MTVQARIALPAIVATLFAVLPGTRAFAQSQVTVITSFPKELTAAYQQAFEKRNPGVKVEILNKGTSAGVAYVREGRPGERPDVFWASAPDAFEILAKDKLLVKYDPGIKGIPEKIGNYPVNDSQGFYRGQALAGYGIMWNTRYLKASKLPEPREWADLIRPAYFGHLAVSSPSRSGTTHLTVETILQGEGWEKGWAQILQIAGNSAAITERSFGVPDGVSNGQFGIGLVIDFFGLAAKNSGFPVEFVYPSATAIVPANIGLINGAKKPDMGRRFIQITLSPEGQELLLDKKISRLPVLPETYAKAPAGYPNPYTGKIRAKVNFDSYLADARDLAFRPLVDETRSRDKALLDMFRQMKRDADASKKMTALEEHWGNDAKKNYARAVELSRGVIRQVGTPMDLYDRPANRFVAEFIGTISVIEGELQKGIGGGLRLVSPDAGVLDLPWREDLPGHGTVALGVRPHAITVTQRDDDASRVWLPGRVTEREFLGEFVRYRARSGSAEFIADAAHRAGNHPFDVGDEVRLGLDPAEMRLLQS